MLDPIQDPLKELKQKATNRRLSGIWVGILTVLVAACVFFCELKLTTQRVEQTVLVASVMLLCCFIMYTSLFDAGCQAVKETPAYQALLKTYEEEREVVRTAGCLEGIEVFCTRYTKRELQEARSRLLVSNGLGMDTFSRYQCGEVIEGLTRKQKFALKQADAMKPLKISAAMLLTGNTKERRRLLIAPGEGRAARVMMALGPTMVGCLMTVNISLEGADLSSGAIALGLLRLFTIFWTGVRGYTRGCVSTEEEDMTALENKAALLREYLKQEKETI